MSYRTLLISAVLAAGTGVAGLAQADILAEPNGGFEVAAPDGLAPTRGMTMNQVASKFGAPSNKVPAVGKPPISRWDYPGFVVYFERDYVIHSVISEAGARAPASEPAAAPAPAASAASEAPTPQDSAPPPPAMEPAAAAPAPTATAAEPESPAP